MADQATRAARQHFGEARGHDGRGRRHQQRVLWRELVELGEDRLLVLDPLGPVLLDELDVDNGFRKAGRDRDPGNGDVGIGGEAMARQRVQFIADQAGGGLQRWNMRIAQSHIPPRSREDRGPGAADQAGADDGDIAFSACHVAFSHPCRLQPEHLAAQIEIVTQGLGGALIDHLAALQRHRRVGQGQRKVEIVIDDDDGDFLAQAIEGFE